MKERQRRDEGKEYTKYSRKEEKMKKDRTNVGSNVGGK